MPADPASVPTQLDPNQFKNFTTELYNKNVELVNANKSLELLQSLYETIINAQTIEQVGQEFISEIINKLAFTDGAVVVKDKKSESLRIIGISHTEIYNTILEVAGFSMYDVKMPLDRYENAMVNAFRTGKDIIARDLIEVWTPIIKHSDLAGTDILSRRSYIFPIAFREKRLGSFVVTSDDKVSSMTEFETKLMDRVKTVFGVAIDRINTSIELKEAQERELEKAKEVIRLKDEFVFIATHDLRTPVTAIKGFVDLLEMRVNDFDDEVKEDFKAIIDATERLDQLVEDLLEVARSESGTIHIESKEVDIIDVVELSAKEVSQMAQESGITIDLALDQENRIVMADPEKLHEVIENLMSNAVKYNKQNGKIIVTSKRVENMLEVSVQDTGIGIPDAMKDKIFEKFFRARQQGTENVPGTGLGLFVVKMLIEKMKGEIEFESEAGVGTKFTIRLPITFSLQ